MIVFMGGHDEACIGINAAKSEGYRTLCIDGNPQSPGFCVADYYAIIDTYDTNAIIKHIESMHKWANVSAVVCVAADIAPQVHAVAKHFDVARITDEAAFNISSKSLMKEAFDKHNVPTARWYRYDFTDLWHDCVPIPCVVKPDASRGARGVTIVRNYDEVGAAIKIAMQYLSGSKNPPIVEEYLEGPQLSVEGYMIRGKAWIPAIFDRNYSRLKEYAPHVIEDGGEMPSKYQTEELRKEVEDVMTMASIAIGHNNGIVKGDLVINNGKIKVIEIACRISGGYFGTVAVPYSRCDLWVERLINWHLSGTTKPTETDMVNESAIRFSFPKAGKVVSISGINDVLVDPDCLYAKLFCRPGDIIHPVTSHACRPAVVVATNKNAAERLINKIKIETV